MDWFSPENIVAVVAALLALVPPAAGAWSRRRSPRHKRIGHRVQMDTAIGGDNGDGNGRPNVRLGLFADLPGMPNPTLVLLRIENDGAGSIADTDYTNPDRDHGLSVVFTGRTVRSVEVIPQPAAEYLMGHFDPVDGKGGLQYRGNTIRLPRVPLNEGQHFKLLVLLSDGGVGGKLDVIGGIQGGEVKRTRSMTVDDKPPLFSRPALGITGLLTFCVLVLAVIIVVRHPPPPTVVTRRPPPMGCATGKLDAIGSTAFAPVLDDLAGQYEADCPNATITVNARGSNDGVQALKDAGDGARNGAPALIALSDGPKPDSYTKLQENSVAVSAFALVVNDQVDVTNLTVDQIRGIYRGDVLNWTELGGPDLPILLVSRDSNSGTRDLFRRHVLGGQGEPAFTSRDCVTKNSPQDKVVRCERGSTEQVLTTVAGLPGAIGYSELRAATAAKGLHTLTINGQAPSIEAIGEDTYPFTEIEYAYTYGAPPTRSLAASFLNYMIRGNGQDVISAHGHLPCFTPEGLERCRK